jgi:FixJ family two-component response regulator
MERRVARLLLTDQKEKQIAHALGLGFDTTHNHVSEIYRKFGVRSRAGLMALWLGGRAESTAPDRLRAAPALERAPVTGS